MKYAEVIAKTVILNKEGSVLLLKRHPKSKKRPMEMDLPGGKVDDGEDIFEGAIREVKEETGINLTKSQIDIVLTESEVTDAKTKCRIFFVASLPKNSELKLSDEHVDFEWVNLQTAIATHNHPPHNRVLKHIGSRLQIEQLVL